MSDDGLQVNNVNRFRDYFERLQNTLEPAFLQVLAYLIVRHLGQSPAL